MEIPSIQLSLEHIEELDFTCPAAKKSINIGTVSYTHLTLPTT